MITAACAGRAAQQCRRIGGAGAADGPRWRIGGDLWRPGCQAAVDPRWHGDQAAVGLRHARGDGQGAYWHTSPALWGLAARSRSVRAKLDDRRHGRRGGGAGPALGMGAPRQEARNENAGHEETGRRCGSEVCSVDSLEGNNSDNALQAASLPCSALNDEQTIL